MTMLLNNENDLVANRQAIAGLVRAHWNPDTLNLTNNERWNMAFDLESHLACLGEAVRCRMPQLFTEYAAWTHDLLVTSGGDRRWFRTCLEALGEQIAISAPDADWSVVARQYLSVAADQLDVVRPAEDSYLADDNPHKALAEGFLNDCLMFRQGSAAAQIHEAIAKGVTIREIYLDVLTPVLHELGRLWHLNRITVGHEHYCTAVAQIVMAQLFPLIFNGAPKQGRLVATCVAGELHEIGARMVSDLFEMNGWDTVFLGADMPTESLINTLIEHDAHVLAISVTLASNLGAVSQLIETVRRAPRCPDVKILVGGAPFNLDESLWQRLGADGWAKDGQTALAIADRWRTR